MKFILTCACLLLLSLNSFAVDQFNTLRWNRGNYNLQNNKTDQNNWFEWWYYKVVVPETGESFFFMYGVVNPWDHSQKSIASRSYIEMGDFSKKLQIKETYSVSKFNASYENTLVDLPGGTATDTNFQGKVANTEGVVSSWNIAIENKWKFNATGWVTGRMLTNIEWHAAQPDATCNGIINSGGREIVLKDAPCYQDRNWGNSFPKWWTWIVSNHFEKHPDTALALGGGNPTFLKRFKFLKGVAIGLKHKGKVYEFRPNDLDKVKVDVNFGKWNIIGINLENKIEIVASAPKDKFMDLQFMTPSGEIFHDFETLTGKVVVKLYKKQFVLSKRWKLLETLTSNFSGIEYGSRSRNITSNIFNSSINLFSNY